MDVNLLWGFWYLGRVISCLKNTPANLLPPSCPHYLMWERGDRGSTTC